MTTPRHSEAAFETVIERHCLLAAPVTSSRQGRTVLVQLRDATAPETGHRNSAYAPIVIEDVEEDAVQVIAELVEVLGTEAPEKS